MKCEEVRELLDPFADGELESAAQTAMAQHLITCPDCSAALKSLEALRATVRTAPRHQAPEALRLKIRERIMELEAADTQAPVWRRRFALAASHLLAVGIGGWLAVSMASERLVRQELTREVMAAHVRSLMDSRLMQVASSDQHTVKPWFTGKLDFSPAVVNLEAQGFPLLGGRLDYLEGRYVAALVYGRRQHSINVFVAPAQTAAGAPTWSVAQNGFAIMAFVANGTSYRAISDLNAAELAEFTSLLRSASQK